MLGEISAILTINTDLIGQALPKSTKICHSTSSSTSDEKNMNQLLLPRKQRDQNLPAPVQARRTFAIISHPDAGKTTLTEKLLMFGGAIQQAGEVRARGERRRARSDWMKIEQDRGISVTASAMAFTHDGCIINLLDTPGHEDFSEDTYRTLTAVDSAVMVIDAAKGIEAQTLKLFEVCRLRDIPIITFVNKMDREARDPFEIIDEIQERLALDVAPVTWPVGGGQRFAGAVDLETGSFVPMDREARERRMDMRRIESLQDPQAKSLVPDDVIEETLEHMEMARELLPRLDIQSYLEGHLTPVFFGSALMSFGVEDLLRALVDLAPEPGSFGTYERMVSAAEQKVGGVVFKIQANMDPKHRDRIAFVRLTSGHFRRGMKLFHVRSGKPITVSAPMLFLAEDRTTADEAYAGDIIGIPNHGTLRIGDMLTEGEILHATNIPSFAPEIMQLARVDDPLRAKHLARALQEFAEEGAASIFRLELGGQHVVGVVGMLQFDVLRDRLEREYKIPVRFEPTSQVLARWIEYEDSSEFEKFCAKYRAGLGRDHNDDPVFLAKSSWELGKAEQDWPSITFRKTKEQTVMN